MIRQVDATKTERPPPEFVGVRGGRKVIRWRILLVFTLTVSLMTGVGILIAWGLFRVFLGNAFPLFPVGLIGAIGPSLLAVSLRLFRTWRQPMDQLPKLD